MTGTIILEFVIIFILVAINGLLSMSELSIISARKARLRSMVESGNRKARTALELNEAPDRMLSTVQIGITMMGILSGAFGGAELTELLDDLFLAIGLSQSTASALAFALVVLTITYLSLVIGELVPKRIALNDPEGVATKLAGPIKLLSKIASPFVSFLSSSTAVVLKLFGMDKAKAQTVSEEEVQMLIDEGTRSGVFEEHERRMVDSIFKMSDLGVKDLMTPRRDIDWLDLSDPIETTIERVRNSTHALFPVGVGSIDTSVGVVNVKDLFRQMSSNAPVDLKAILCEAVMIPETATAFEGLELLRNGSSSMAFIVDEYGGIDGIVTQIDLLTAIAGDMASTEGEPMIVKRADGSYLLDGRLPIEEFRELLPTPGMSIANEGYHTVAGFVLSYFSRIPRAGDSFAQNGYKVEVIDLDGNRIDKILLSTMPTTDADGSNNP